METDSDHLTDASARSRSTGLLPPSRRPPAVSARAFRRRDRDVLNDSFTSSDDMNESFKTTERTDRAALRRSDLRAPLREQGAASLRRLGVDGQHVQRAAVLFDLF